MGTNGGKVWVLGLRETGASLKRKLIVLFNPEAPYIILIDSAPMDDGFYLPNVEKH